MKTAKYFKEQIGLLQNPVEKPKTSAEVRKNKERIVLYNTCKMYMDTKPKKSFIEKEILRLENRINEIMKIYIPLDPEKVIQKLCTKHRVDFQKEMDIPKLKRQLSVLKLILE